MGAVRRPLNIAAGEDLRWLPRHLTTQADLAADDYWLLDDNRVVFTVFEPGGRFAGGAQTVDPVIVEHCRRVHDYVWKLAILHHAYTAA